MKLDRFVENYDLIEKNEIEKVKYLSFFFLKSESLFEFNQSDIIRWFTLLNYGQPNCSRLLKNIKNSAKFIKGTTSTSFKLHAKTIKLLTEEIPDLLNISEDIISQSTILPEVIFRTNNQRRYLVKLCEQINASYEHNLFDACAVLMRRLLEILLIHAYQKNAQEAHIQTVDGSFKELKAIIQDATSTNHLALSKSTKSCLDSFRILGNFAAHKITYNTTRNDIKVISLEYRATIEELLYMAGLQI